MCSLQCCISMLSPVFLPFKSYISFKYAKFNTSFGCNSYTTWWYCIFIRFNLAPLLASPNMLDSLNRSPIGKFRCGNWWYSLTDAFDLRIDALNTVIISLCRYGIKYSCRYLNCVFLCVSIKVTLPLIFHCFGTIPLISEIFHLDWTLIFEFILLSCGFISGILLSCIP